MKTKNKYTERLLKFAKHIEQITNHYEFGLYQNANLVEIKEFPHVTTPLVYHFWVFEELPIVFREWYFHKKTGEPSFKGFDYMGGTLGAVVDYFDLTLKETLHLFDLEGKQDVEVFGGTHLNFESDGPVLAKNIYDLIEYRNEVEKTN